MRKYGVNRQVVSRAKFPAIEPAVGHFDDVIAGGTYTASDESGDAKVFAQTLAERCAAKRATLMCGQDIVRLKKVGNAIDSVAVSARNTLDKDLKHAQTVDVRADA